MIGPPHNPSIVICMTPELDVVDLCRNLIRIDSSNYGDGSGPGEREAAEYIMTKLTEVGWDPEYFESQDRRATVVLRIPGVDSTRPALVVHGHSDVVPAQAEDWKMDPFGGDEMDGMIWGRGAVDMKDMDAMILAVVRDMKRTGWQPPRDLVIAFFADEEAGGVHGSHYTVDNRPDLFEGATEAISEVGGFSIEINGRRAYLLQTAEKGIAWTKLIAHGRAGHGSQINEENAVTELAAAVARIGAHKFDVSLGPTVRAFLDGVADLTGISIDHDNPEDLYALVNGLGSAGKFVGATLAGNANPTQLGAGYKANVIPGSAEATIDVRFLPGEEEATVAKIEELAGPNVTVEKIHRDVALESPHDGDLVDSMIAALDAEDPGAAVLPYMLSGGTDNKALSKLGITGYGFAPLRLPGDLDFAGMFHGVDERVPVESLEFGVRVLERFLRTC